MKPVIKPFIRGYIANCGLCGEPVRPVNGMHGEQEIEYCIWHNDGPICLRCAHTSEDVFGGKGLAFMLNSYRNEYGTD